MLWAEIKGRGLVIYIVQSVSSKGKLVGVPVTLVSGVPNGWQAMLRVRRAVTDGADGLFLAYAERKGALITLRYSPRQGILWSLQVGNPVDANAFHVCEDGQGGLLLAFVSATPSPQIELKRFDANGALTWDIKGPGSVPIQISLPPGSTTWRPENWMALAQAVPDSRGGAILIYQNWSVNRPGPKLFIACFNDHGILIGPIQEVTTLSTSQDYPVIGSPGGVAAVVAWADDGQSSSSSGLNVWAQRVGCCLPPQPIGEIYPPPELFCEILPLPGTPFKELVLRLPCGNRERQFGLLPLSRFCMGVRGVDCPDCVMNRDATCPDWMRIRFWGLPEGFGIQLQNRDGSVIEEAQWFDAGESADIRQGYYVLTFSPKTDRDPLLVFSQIGKKELGVNITVRIETDWGEGQPLPLMPSSLKKHAKGQK